jgi:hypothetical protein
MSTFRKQATSAVLSVTTAVWLVGSTALVPVASAQTVGELQAQIQSLLATIAALQVQLSAMTGGTSGGSMSGAGCYNYTRDLTLGATGDDVKALQQFLNGHGAQVAASGAGSPGNESSYFGPLTQAALAKYQAANAITPSVGYFGPKTRAHVTAACASTGGTGGTGGTGSTTSGLNFMVALDNPAGASLPKGATNVNFLKFKVTGNGTITSLTVRRAGPGATSDFSNVYLYDGATRLTSGRSINSSSHEANFNNLNIVVNGEKTLWVAGDISTTAGASDRNSLSVVAATGSATVGGLPVSGNEMAITGVSAGTAMVVKNGSLSNPNIGQSDAQVSQFRLSASNEDVKVSRIALFYSGTLSKSNIMNFELKDQTGAVIATVASVSDKDLIVFELATPYTVLKGENKTFSVYADISGAAKAAETIKIYVDENTDILAVGQQFGFGVSVTKTGFDSDGSDHHVLTLQGGTFTITFKGPNAGDLAKNAKDVVLYEFDVAAANNVEIRNTRFTVAVSSSQAGVDDFKVVDKDSGMTVAGPRDDASGSVVLTDVYNVNSGQARHFKVTGDLDNNWASNDNIVVTLVAFTAGADIKNLDNNQFLAASEIVPNSNIAGNTQTVKAASLEVTLAGTPVSQSFVKGSTGVGFVGVNLKAVNTDIKVTTLKLTASPASGTLATMRAQVNSVALYDGATQVGTTKSIQADGTVTFDNLNYTITKGSTKTLTLKANITSDATANNEYAFGIVNVADTTGVDAVGLDPEGNEPAYGGSDSLNMSAGVKVTILGAGSLTVATNPDDGESKAAIVPASASKAVAAKFKFTATNEDLTVKKLRLKINNVTTSATAPASTAEVTQVYLYDGTTLLGQTTLGTDGTVDFQNLSWLVAKDTSKVMTVKVDTNTLSGTGNGTSGRSVYVHVLPDSFEANGAASTLTLLSGASAGVRGNEKVVYKTYPEITVQTDATVLVGGTNDLLKFTVTNKTSNEQLSWKIVSFNVNAAGATLPGFGAGNSAVTVTVRDLTNSINLAVGTVATAGNAQAAQYLVELTNEEAIAQGSARQYRLSVGSVTTDTNDNVSTQLVLRTDATVGNISKGVVFRTAANPSSYTQYNNAVVDATDSGFVWSDNSGVGHSLTTTDWANGVYVDTFPSDTKSLSN